MSATATTPTKGKQKLFELLPKRETQQNLARQILAETTKTFSDKPALFKGQVTTTKAIDQERANVLDNVDHVAPTTTVPSRLEYTFKAVLAELDTAATIDATNPSAKANIEIDGKVFMENIPAQTLLTMENRIKQWIDTVKCAPTLEQGIYWDPDTDRGAHFYKSRYPEIKDKTEQRIIPQVLVAATERHPAQVDKIPSQVPVAKIHVEKISGMVSSAYKNRLLERLQKLYDGVLEARQRANDCPIVDLKMADTLFKYIMTDSGE